jgi:hypothetical protein
MRWNFVNVFLNVLILFHTNDHKHIILMNSIKDQSISAIIRNIKKTDSKIIYENELLKDFNVVHTETGKCNKGIFHHDFIYGKSRFHEILKYEDFCTLEKSMASKIVNENFKYKDIIIIFDDLEFLYDESIIYELSDIKNEIQKYVLIDIDIDNLPKYNLPIIRKNKDKLIFYWKNNKVI